MEKTLRKFFLKPDEQDMKNEEALDIIKMRIELFAKTGKFDLSHLREAIKDVYGDDFDWEIERQYAYRIDNPKTEIDVSALKTLRESGLFKNWDMSEEKIAKTPRVNIKDLMPKALYLDKPLVQQEMGNIRPKVDHSLPRSTLFKSRKEK